MQVMWTDASSTEPWTERHAIATQGTITTAQEHATTSAFQLKSYKPTTKVT